MQDLMLHSINTSDILSFSPHIFFKRKVFNRIDTCKVGDKLHPVFNSHTVSSGVARKKIFIEAKLIIYFRGVSYKQLNTMPLW